ncbi:MlaD family protein [Chitinispirillales bacterium ANBcel5]|uniref:MlaD family protein n=1 Tax=Cellulosispirillum alkaliphilum TaxID=3039283 RepID=UPI002A554A88|nr:MlaD family protein [Chitinispirillales bacterium ANBcel5]
MSISVSQKARLGVFVVIGSIVLSLLIAVPLGFRFRDKQKTYIAYFSGETLSGLEQGAVVKFNGVPIGNVNSIAYLPHDLSSVKVTLRINSDFPVKVDMYATTGSLGITGLKYIEISGGSNESELLKEGAELPTRVSMMGSITGRAESIAERIELLLAQLNQFADPDREDGINSIVENLSHMSGDAREFFNDDFKGFFETLTPGIQRMSESSEEVIEKVGAIADNIEMMTNTLNESFRAEQFNSILTRVDSTAASMTQLSDNLSMMILQTREDFSVSMENIRRASENANQLTRMLSENPSLLLRGEGREREIR